MIFTTQINPTCGTYVLQSLQGHAHGINFLFFFKKISIDSVVTDSEGYNGFHQVNIPFKFSRINHRPLVILDDCSKCCEINTVSLIYGSFQVLPWSNDSIIEKMDGWKWCHHITDFFQYMHAWNQGCIKIVIYDISLLQFLFCKNTANFKECVDAVLFYNKKGAYHRMDGCNWNCELALKKGMTASACFKETQYTISL